MDVFAELLKTVLPLVVSAVLSYCFGRLTKRSELRDQKELQRDKDREHRGEQIRILLNNQKKMIEECKSLNQSVETIAELQDKMRIGLKTSLQGDLLSYFHKFEKAGGHLSQDDYSHWLQTYKAYHDIGGNSFCDKLNDQVEEMEVTVRDD